MLEGYTWYGRGWSRKRNRKINMHYVVNLVNYQEARIKILVATGRVEGRKVDGGGGRGRGGGGGEGRNRSRRRKRERGQEGGEGAWQVRGGARWSGSHAPVSSSHQTAASRPGPVTLPLEVPVSAICPPSFSLARSLAFFRLTRRRESLLLCRNTSFVSFWSL